MGCPPRGLLVWQKMQRPVGPSYRRFSGKGSRSLSSRAASLLQVQPLWTDPLVLLYPVGPWSAEQDATVSYVTAPEFVSSAWDWIGLYKVTFRHANDYVMYVWVQDNEVSSGEDVRQVYLGAEGLPRAGGEFLLGYYSNALRSIVGISQPVQVRPSQRSVEQHMGWGGASSTERLQRERPPCDF